MLDGNELGKQVMSWENRQCYPLSFHPRSCCWNRLSNGKPSPQKGSHTLAPPHIPSGRAHWDPKVVQWLLALFSVHGYCHISCNCFYPPSCGHETGLWLPEHEATTAIQTKELCQTLRKQAFIMLTLSKHARVQEKRMKNLDSGSTVSVLRRGGGGVWTFFF